MFKYFLYFLTLLFIFLTITPVMTGNDKKYTSEQFLNMARNAHPEKTCAILIGTVSNKRRDTPSTYETHKADIKVGMRFTASRVLAKTTIKEIGEELSESYMVGQPYNGQPVSILASEKKDDDIPLLGKFGLRPEDLTMAFLYWNLKKELANESVKGFDCRVLELINPKTKEFVKVYISDKYLCPIKVEWFKPSQKTSIPYRNVIISSFKTEGNLGAPSELNLYGPGWKTKVDFTNIRLGYTKDGIPKDIFTNSFPRPE
jgi:hypothetical protein